MQQNEDSHEPLIYDLESYQLPAILRRVLKVTKLEETVEICSSKMNKLIDNLPDEAYGIFDVEKIGKFKKQVKITFKLLRIEPKAHVMKTIVAEQLERLQFLENVASKFAERS